jgi:hypothetical protein
LSEAELAVFGDTLRAVKNYVVGVENGTIDPRKSFGDEALAADQGRSGSGSAVLVILAVAAVGVTLWAISSKGQRE